MNTFEASANMLAARRSDHDVPCCALPVVYDTTRTALNTHSNAGGDGL